jgi:hypothetical protein
VRRPQPRRHFPAAVDSVSASAGLVRPGPHPSVCPSSAADARDRGGLQCAVPRTCDSKTQAAVDLTLAWRGPTCI